MNESYSLYIKRPGYNLTPMAAAKWVALRYKSIRMSQIVRTINAGLDAAGTCAVLMHDEQGECALCNAAPRGKPGSSQRYVCFCVHTEAHCNGGCFELTAAPTWRAIAAARTPKELLLACHLRGEYIDSLVKKIELNTQLAATLTFNSRYNS